LSWARSIDSNLEVLVLLSLLLFTGCATEDVWLVEDTSELVGVWAGEQQVTPDDRDEPREVRTHTLEVTDDAVLTYEVEDVDTVWGRTERTRVVGEGRLPVPGRLEMHDVVYSFEYEYDEDQIEETYADVPYGSLSFEPIETDGEILYFDILLMEEVSR